MLRISSIILLIVLLGNDLWAQKNKTQNTYSYDQAGMSRFEKFANFDRPIKIEENKENQIVYQFEKLQTTSLDELKTAIDDSEFYSPCLTLKIDPNANFDIADFNSMAEREYEARKRDTRFQFRVILEETKGGPAGLSWLPIPFWDDIAEYKTFLDKYEESNEMSPGNLKKRIISIRKDDILIDGESVDIEDFRAKLAASTKGSDKWLVILSPEPDVDLLRLSFFKIELNILRYEKLNKTAMFYYEKQYNHLPDVLQQEVEMDAGFFYTITGLSSSIQDYLKRGKIKVNPYLKACNPDEIATSEALEACTLKQISEFIAQNLKYPTVALENGIDGSVLISIEITKEGKIGTIRAENDSHEVLREEALRIFNKMKTQGWEWEPAEDIHGNTAVVRITFPVNFRLN